MARKQKSFLAPSQMDQLNQLLEKGWFVKEISPATSGLHWLVIAEERTPGVGGSVEIDR